MTWLRRTHSPRRPRLKWMHLSPKDQCEKDLPVRWAKEVEEFAPARITLTNHLNLQQHIFSRSIHFHRRHFHHRRRHRHRHFHRHQIVWHGSCERRVLNFRRPRLAHLVRLAHFVPRVPPVGQEGGH
eukprot:scaffold151524_cov52-Attheya_sp.AAC.1